MESFEVDFGPGLPSYNSLSEAVVSAQQQPAQLQAIRDGNSVADAKIEIARFGASRGMLQFSNGWHFSVEAKRFSVHWRVSQGVAPLVESVPPRQVFWQRGERSSVFDPNAVAQVLIGAVFLRLRVTGRALLVYTRGNRICWLNAYRERESQRDFLHISFD